MYMFFFCTDIGKRNSQQDCLYVDGDVIFSEHFCDRKSIEKERALFAVCDGMGGLSKGEKISIFVGKEISKMNIPFSEDGIYEALRKVQKKTEIDFYMSGTTIVGVYMNGRKSIIFNAGDSRVYKITEDGIIYLSHDHSYVQKLVDTGVITYEEAFYHPARNILEFGIGDVFKQEWDNGVKPYIKTDYLDEGEYYLITTDGVHGELTDQEIFSLLWPDPFKQIDTFLLELEKRKRDNFTFILLTVI